MNRISLLPQFLLVASSVLSTAAHAGGPMKSFRVRAQATKWNVARLFNPTDPTTDGMSLVTFAGAKKSDLRHWMRTCPAPSLAEMHGSWRGLNRGVGPALIGVSQFVKQMSTTGSTGYGDNISIQQIGPNEWSCGQWQPKLKCNSIDRHGNYVVTPPNCEGPNPHAAVISYAEADNPKLDPSRFIVDKIVKLSDNYLLGRAMVKLGRARITVGYFVLERAG